MDETQMKIMSHASILIKRNGVSLIIDPWVLGSCYWRSWWNIPEPAIDQNELSEVDHLILTHIHWDHWHGPSIKKYFRGKSFLIPNDPNRRSCSDLRRMGEKNIQLVNHGQTVELGGGIKVTIYQFGLYINDAAVVIETPEIRMLNANDAKIAGSSLRQIINTHGDFDFALRSHSSANARVCFYQRDAPDASVDDEKHYARSFKLFMDKVRPRYAVPFASNHCHLHKDTFRFNKNITNPLKLRKQLTALGGIEASELVIMLPGSSWSSRHGFSCVPEKVFEDIDSYLEQYKIKVAKKLNAYYRQEEAVRIDDKLLQRYFRLIGGIPPWKRWKFKSFRAVYEFRYPSGRCESYMLSPLKKEAVPVTEAESAESRIKISYPAIVFRDAVNKNMFAHARISKRGLFVAQDKTAMSELKSFLALHSRLESGVYPVSMLYMLRFLGAYSRRWREVIVYVYALWYMRLMRRPEYEVEEKILKKT